MMDWQPMETAPRDGSRIRVWVPYTSNTEATCADVGWWVPDTSGRSPPWAKELGGYFDFDGSDGPFDIQPTHWAPPA